MIRKIKLITIIIITFIIMSLVNIVYAGCYQCDSYQGHNSCSGTKGAWSGKEVHSQACCCGRGTYRSHNARAGEDPFEYYDASEHRNKCGAGCGIYYYEAHNTDEKCSTCGQYYVCSDCGYKKDHTCSSSSSGGTTGCTFCSSNRHTNCKTNRFINSGATHIVICCCGRQTKSSHSPNQSSRNVLSSSASKHIVRCTTNGCPLPVEAAHRYTQMTCTKCGTRYGQCSICNYIQPHYCDTIPPLIEQVPGMQIYNQASKTVSFSIYVSDPSGIDVGATKWFIYANETLWGTSGSEGVTYDSSTHLLSKTVTLPDGSDGWSANCIYNARPIIYDTKGNYVDVRQNTSQQIQIMIDTAAPTIGSISGIQYKNTASGGTVGVTASSLSDNLSGLYYCDWYYMINSGSWSAATRGTISGTSSTFNVPITTEGTYTVRIWLYDNAGNGSYKDTTVVIDRTAPTIGSISGIQYKNTASGGTVGVTASGLSDNLSGLYYCDWYYMINSGSWSAATRGTISSSSSTFNVPITSEGTYTVRIWLYDNAGNGAYKDTTVVIDRTAPYVLSITYDPGWKNTSVTKDVSFGDALSGVRLIEYSYDLNTWYSDWDSGSGGSVRKTWGGERNQVLYFRATDNAGNTYVYAYDGVNPSAYDLKIDTTAPTIESVPAMQIYNEKGKTVTFSIKVADNLSGVNIGATTWHIYAGDTLWSTSGAEGVSYDANTHMLSKTVTLPSGSDAWIGNIIYNARPVIYDNAGNYIDIRNDTSKQIQVMIDTTAPTVGGHDETKYTNNVTGTVRVNLYNVADNLSGVKEVLWWLYKDGTLLWSNQAGANSGTTYYKDITLSGEGTYRIHGVAYDNAGNAYDWHTEHGMVIIADGTAPTNLGIGDSGITSNPEQEVTIWAKAEDTLSGLDHIQINAWINGSWTNYCASKQSVYNATTGRYEAAFGLAEIPDTVSGTTNNGEGTYIFDVYAYDKAGNNTYCGQLRWICDSTPPEVVSITYYGDDVWHSSTLYEDVVFRDEISGMSKIEYSYDQTTWYTDWDSNKFSSDGKQLSSKKTWSGEQDRELWFRATDNAGNVYKYPGPYDLQIDSTAPIVLVSSVTYPSDVNISLSDELSYVTHWGVTSSTTAPSTTASSNTTTGTALNIWYPIAQTDGTTAVKYTGLAVGSYYAWAKDAAGNTKYTQFKVNKATITAPSSPAAKTYNGASQNSGITAPANTSIVTASSTTSATNAGTYNVVLKLNDATNYTWSDGTTANKTVSWTINKKAVTVTAVAQTITYGGNIATGTSYATLASQVSGHTLSAVTLKASTTTVTTSGTITPSAATIKSGSTDVTANYSITYNTGKLTINAAKITAPSSPSAKTYNGSSQNSGITAPANTSIVTASSTTSATNAGTYNVVLKLNDTTNYTWSDGTTANKTVTWTINKKAVTVTAAAQTITYGGSIATGTSYATLASQVSGHTLSAVTLKASTTTVTTTGTITPSAATIKNGSTDVTANYSITYNTGKLTINAAKITAPSSPSAKTYNGASQNSGITAPSNTSIVTASSTTSATNAGTYNVVLKLNDTTNYTWSDGTTANKTVTWKINKKAVTVTAVAQTITYGGNIATGTSYATLASQVSGHTLSAVTLKASTTTVTTTGTITPSAATIKSGSTDVTSNYSITYNTGKLTINAAKITVPSSPAAKTYNGSSQNSGITAPSNTSIVTASSTTSATNAGTYNVVLKLNDATNYTWSDGTTANKTVTWKINKATVGAPTNVAVSTAGVVTWTAGSNATSHQISIDGTNWTTATTGVDYNSTITAATGNRTIYVRALNSDTTNYTTPSSNGSKTVTVYKLTINKGTGISSVSGAGNYISGRSVTINASTSTGYTWSKWTVESGSTPANVNNANTTVTVGEITTLTATTTATALTFKGQTLAAGTYNAEYSQTFTGASSGTGTYTYAINSVTCDGTAVTASSGKYNGLSLSGTTISGTPTRAGTYVFAVKATDKTSGATANANITIVINKIAGKVELDATSGNIIYPNTTSFNVKTNTSGGGLSVSTSDSAVATASVSGTKVTVTPGTTAGEATITVTSAATTNYNAASATYTVTVNNGSLNVSASGYSGTYDGAAHGISVSATNVTEASITYCATQNGTYSSTKPTYINAGTYTTWYKVTKAGYTTVTGSKTVAISKATITVPSSPAAKTYNSSSQNSGITAPSNTSIVTASSTTSATNAGTYNVVLKLNDTANYTWSDGTTANKTVTWKINKYNLSNATIASVSAQTYTGSAINPTPAVTVPIPSGKTTTVTTTDIEYSYTNNTNVGTATIKITAKSTSTNYTGNKSTTFEISTRSISGGTVTLTPTTYVFDGTAKEPTVTLQVNGKTLTKGTEYGVVYTNNTNVGTATVTITGKGNYSGTATKTFTITNASLNVSSSGYTGTYNGAAHGITVNVTGVTGASITYSTTQNGTYSTTKPTYTDAGTYTVYYKVTKTNYSTVTGSKTVTINRKEITVEWSNKQLVYNGKEQLPTAKAESGVAGETINLIVERAQINVGQYVAVAKIQSVTGGREKASNYKIVD